MPPRARGRRRWCSGASKSPRRLWSRPSCPASTRARRAPKPRRLERETGHIGVAASYDGSAGQFVKLDLGARTAGRPGDTARRPARIRGSMTSRPGGTRGRCADRRAPRSRPLEGEVWLIDSWPGRRAQTPRREQPRWDGLINASGGGLWPLRGAWSPARGRWLEPSPGHSRPQAHILDRSEHSDRAQQGSARRSRHAPGKGQPGDAGVLFAAAGFPWAHAPDRWLVSEPAANAVHVLVGLPLSLQLTTTIAGAPQPVGIAVNAAHGIALVACRSGAASVIDLASNAQVAVIDIPAPRWTRSSPPTATSHRHRRQRDPSNRLRRAGAARAVDARCGADLDRDQQ